MLNKKLDLVSFWLIQSPESFPDGLSRQKVLLFNLSYRCVYGAYCLVPCQLHLPWKSQKDEGERLSTGTSLTRSSIS